MSVFFNVNAQRLECSLEGMIQMDPEYDEKNNVKEILDVAKKRISYQKSNPYVAPWWIDVIALMQNNFQYQGHTLDEVSVYFNVTRERVRQIEAKALRKLRHPSRSRLLKDYLI